MKRWGGGEADPATQQAHCPPYTHISFLVQAVNCDSGFREPRVASRSRNSPRLLLHTGQGRHEESWCPSPVWHTLQAPV